VERDPGGGPDVDAFDVHSTVDEPVAQILGVDLTDLVEVHQAE
jgi:hypothetical protein